MLDARILVYCAEPSHETKSAMVGLLTRRDLSALWQAGNVHLVSASELKKMQPAPIVDGVYRTEHREVLYDDAAVSQLVPAADGDDIPDWKYNLRCDLCGLHLERGAAAAKPVLDQLADAGVSTVSLRSLIRLLLR
jgi:hypothetical protein